MRSLVLINELVRDRKEFVSRSLNQGLSLRENATLLVASVFFYAIYGIIIGANHSPLQAGISGLKLPLLFIITSLICFPTLYFFLSVLGLKQTAGQLFSFMLFCVNSMSIVLAVFTPITLFFLVTTDDYLFFKLLNVAIFSVAGIVGLGSFYKNIHASIKNIGELSDRTKAIIFLNLWLVMFAFVGCQLSYTLSPFFGDPGLPVILFTDAKDGFYTDVIQSVRSMLNR